MSVTEQLAPRKEIFSWAMYDFANSGYTTVVLTAVFNAYFVGVVAASLENGQATFLWVLTLAVANLLVLVSAPVIGAIADQRASKKKFLLLTTIGCVVATAMLGWVGPGDIVLAIGLIIFSNYMFALGEGLIAAFLPEISPPQDMGRVSGFGWTIGYLGGLLVLGLSLAYVSWAQNEGLSPENTIPVTMWITAAMFALAALPTFLWLRERATASENKKNYFSGLASLIKTLKHAHHYRDLFRFLIALAIFYSGIHTVIVIAAVYAQEVMGFTTQDSITLILIVNITAALGAFVFGFVQDKIGSINTLGLTLALWVIALLTAYFSETRIVFWLVANLIGLAMGASQSAGRALVGQFSPPGQSAEFFGLWTFAVRLAAIIGPVSYGITAYLTKGDHKLALLITILFFVAGGLMLLTIDEQRGRKAAL